MMKNILTIAFSVFLIVQTQAQTEIFNALLSRHVDTNGNVDYKNFKKDEAKLDNYLAYLAKTNPEKSWSAAKTKAFWVNAYNGYTIKIILKNYPLKSILKIKEKGKDAWNIPFAIVGDKTYTLNTIEHGILRKTFKDPKIHVAVNCASGSCPQIANVAFTEANYEAKTEELMKKFINDPTKNKISEKKIQISKIFEWFKGDFIQNGSLIDFLNQYSTIKIKKRATIRFLEYDWNLNGK